MLTAVDLGCHIANGRELLHGNLQVLFENYYSFTMPSSKFINHHWLFGVIVYLLNQSFGLIGTHLFNTVVLSFSFFLLFKLISQNTSKTISSLLALIAVFFLSTRTEIRPESLGFLFITHSLWQISKILTSNKILNSQIFLLILQQLLWVNTHISFIFGIFLLVLFFGCSKFLNSPALKNKTRSKLLTLSVCLIAVSLLNPNHFHGLLTPINIFTNYGYTIVENQTLLFLWRVINHPILIAYLLFSIPACTVVISNLSDLSWYERILFFFGLIFGFLALRNLPIFVAFTFPVVAKAMHSPLKKLSSKLSFSLTPKNAIAFTAQIYLLFTLLIITGNFHPSHHWRFRGIGQVQGEDEVINFIKHHQLATPIFNNYDIGSYLIYYLYPQVPVFVDNRPEAYNSEFLQKTYIRMQEDPQVWEQVVNEYQIETVIFGINDITPWAQQFLYLIEQNSNWEKVYLDRFVAIWRKV